MKTRYIFTILYIFILFLVNMEYKIMYSNKSCTNNFVSRYSIVFSEKRDIYLDVKLIACRDIAYNQQLH